MSQNAVTIEAAQSTPVLQMITTEAPFQAAPDKALIAQVDNSTIVIEFQNPVVQPPAAKSRRRRRLAARIYSYSVLALMSASVVVGTYSLLTLQH